MPDKKPPLLLRVLCWYLLGTAVRSAYAIYIGMTSGDVRSTWEGTFGPAVWIGEALYAFAATGAVTAIWMGSRLAFQFVVAAMAVSASLLIFQLQQTEADPLRARAAYAESRRARGFPVDDARLDQMFSPAGRRVTWAVGAVFELAPMLILIVRRQDLSDDRERD